MTTRDEALLGLATTRELLAELDARLEVNDFGDPIAEQLHGDVKDALGDLTAKVLDYRTVETLNVAGDDELDALRSSNVERRQALGARGVQVDVSECATGALLFFAGPDVELDYHRRVNEILDLVEKQVDDMERRSRLLAPPPPGAPRPHRG